MNYEELLEFSVELAVRLQKCGAETYRVEETITRLLEAYGIEADASVIPNSITVGFRGPDGVNHNKIRRIKDCENVLDGVEKYSSLCRRLCIERPDMDRAWQMLEETTRSVKRYGTAMFYVACITVSAAFAVFFKGTLLDAFCSAVCGLATGLCMKFMSNFHANQFFKTVVGGFVIGFVSHAFAHVGLCDNPDASSIGAIMLLVPGFLFTNSLRDIIYGDTMSGVNRLVQVLIIAVALVVGVGAAVNFTSHIWGAVPGSASLVEHSLVVQCIAAMLGTLGFGMLFDIHGNGMLLCLLGAAMSWLVYCGVVFLGATGAAAFFFAAAACSLYAEVLARVRKYPAISYLYASLVPLIPGAGIYYAVSYLTNNEAEAFLSKGMETAAAAGSMAVGVLLVSTAFRMWGVYKKKKMESRKLSCSREK